MLSYSRYTVLAPHVIIVPAGPYYAKAFEFPILIPIPRILRQPRAKNDAILGGGEARGGFDGAFQLAAVGMEIQRPSVASFATQS